MTVLNFFHMYTLKMLHPFLRVIKVSTQVALQKFNLLLGVVLSYLTRILMLNFSEKWPFTNDVNIDR
ncbi:hypothetical protein HMI56_002444 [Coelomomyces lativittatus]|nr:hypothetical protein HMI56_002444 [Coelomomyces lativittatus]